MGFKCCFLKVNKILNFIKKNAKKSLDCPECKLQSFNFITKRNDVFSSIIAQFLKSSRSFQQSDDAIEKGNQKWQSIVIKIQQHLSGIIQIAKNKLLFVSWISAKKKNKKMKVDTA